MNGFFETFELMVRQPAMERIGDIAVNRWPICASTSGGTR
jgi:hypothetical protein